jgi:putative membrane protein
MATVAGLTPQAGCRHIRSMLGRHARTPAEQAAAIEGNLRSDADILGVLHQSNVAEIDAGRVAQQRTSDGEVRSFANTMVMDHTTLDRNGTALAARLGMTPNLSDNTVPHLAEEELEELNEAGGNFDRVYIQYQIDDHLRTLNIVDFSIGRASRAEVRAALQNQIRPAVSAHLTRAQNIQARIGAP